MTFVAVAVLWCVFNGLVYVAAVRSSRGGATETGILRFHLYSFAGLLIIGCLWLIALPSGETLAGLVAALALHGIYSLTFLESWTVTENSFVFRTLGRIEASRGRPLDLRKLEEVGAAKRSNRLQSLVGLGLVARDAGGTCSLTAGGRLVCGMIEALAWLTRIRQGG